MSDTAKNRLPEEEPILPYLLTPLLLLILCGGILALVWCFAPTHTVEKYLNVAFMDDLKTKSASDGLTITELEISTETPEITYEAGEITYPTFGQQYASLYSQDIELSVGVYFGTNSELLKRGACQSTQSAVPGAGGNTVIDAHVNTYFADLYKLEKGNTVILYTTYGKFTYKVTQKLSFQKSDTRWLRETTADCLTLYTCAPQVLGSSDQRVGVRCELVSAEYYQPKA